MSESKIEILKKIFSDHTDAHCREETLRFQVTQIFRDNSLTCLDKVKVKNYNLKIVMKIFLSSLKVEKNVSINAKVQ